jgi:UTP--glucose-1-phosphate uridylyltransferase
MKAVVPAAGLGARFLPHTKAQPKEMIPLVDKPAIQFVVEEAVAGDMRAILIVTAAASLGSLPWTAFEAVTS